jgi:hypothetical protein
MSRHRVRQNTVILATKKSNNKEVGRNLNGIRTGDLQFTSFVRAERAAKTFVVFYFYFTTVPQKQQ